MRRTGARGAAVCLLLAGCTASPPDGGPRAGEVLASFSGEVDAVTGEIRILAEPAAAEGKGPAPRSAVELPVVQDGVRGSGPADTIELVTESATSIAGGCGPVDGYEGGIRLRSFYAGAVLTGVHVELTAIAPTGREACNGVPAAGGLSDAFGLFSYGTVGRAGTIGDAVLRAWRFRLPDATAFTFRGHVVADAVVTSDPTPPATEATPAGGTYAAGTEIALACADAETGCAATYYTTDGTAPTAASAVYSAPLRLASSFTLRFFSVDHWGNAGPIRTVVYALEGPERVVSGPGSATLEPGGVAFDAAGDGLAVWRTSGQKVLYACFDAAASAWSAPAVLDADGGSGHEAPRVAAGTSSFAVAWFGGQPGIQASVFTGCTPGPVQTLATQLFGYDLAVGSNGPGFLVAWSGTQSGSQAAVFDGGTWTQRSFTPDVYVDGLAVAGDGSGYRVVYRKSPNAWSVRFQGGLWSTPESLGYTGSLPPAVASSGGITCTAWGGGPVYARVDSGGAGSTTAVTSGSAQGLAVAMSGARCQVVLGTATGAVGAVHDGAAWSAAGSLGVPGSVTDVGVAPFGAADFALVALQAGDVWVSRSAGGVWGAGRRAESAAEPARFPLLASGSLSAAWVLFAQADGTADRVWSARYDGAAVAAPEVRSSSVDGAASGPRVAVAANGDVLAIWTQEHLARSNVYWALGQGGLWGAPQLLASDATAEAIASSGADFLVAYATRGPSPALVARRFSAGAFGAPTTVSTGSDGWRSVRLASDGSGYALGYVVYLSYSTGYQPVARILDGATGSWLAEKTLTFPGSESTEVSVAGRPGEYVFAWINETQAGAVSAMSWRATKPSASWTWESAPATIESGTGYAAIALAPGPGGFAAVYATTALRAAILSGGAWGAPATLRSESPKAYAVASNGTGWLVASSATSGTQSHAWSGAWRAARSLGTAWASGLSVASDGSGYGVLVNVFSPWQVAYVAVPEPLAGAIAAPVRVDTTRPTSTLSSPLVATPLGFLALWPQDDPVDRTIARLYARGSL